MIIEALQIMLFGMLGIFVVMGIILLCIMGLKRVFSRPSKPTDPPAPHGEGTP
ncbi:MAG: OadG family protein [Oscillospiraceae bacterium]